MAEEQNLPNEEDVKKPEAEVEEKEVEQKAKQLPEPSGYHILCTIPDAEEKYDSCLAFSSLLVVILVSTSSLL